MSFGYSFGDFVAGANISYRLIQVLSQSQGASIEYQEAISELATLQQTFLQVGYMRPSKHLSQATINAASHIVLSSMDLIGDFLAKTKRYRERLCGRGTGNAVSDSWQKMGWVLFKKDELKELRDTLHLKLSNIGVLLSTAHFHGRIPSQIAKYEVKTPDIDTFRTPSPPPSYVNTIPEAEVDGPTTPNAKPMTRYISTSRGAIEDDESGKSSAISEIEARFARLEELFMQQNKPGLPNADGTQNAALIENQSAINEEFVSLEESLEQQTESSSPATSESQIRQPTNKASTLSSEVLTRFEQFLRSHENEESQQSKLIARLESMLAIKGDTQDGSTEKHQKPIKFKDAVGRKFSFPFHLCQTWGGMEELIKQAFLHVDVIGPHVHEGHYDLVGPNGEIILPQVWETMIQPDWSITMHMWPIPDPKPPAPPPPPPALPPVVWQRGPPSRPSQRPGTSSSKSRPTGFPRPYKARGKPIYIESDDSDQEEVKQGSKGVMRWMSKANQIFKKKAKESKYSDSDTDSLSSNSIIMD